MIEMHIDTSELIELQGQLQFLEDNRVANLIPAASLATVTIKDRISKGFRADGKIMISKSNKPYGRYSKAHTNRRKKRKLQVSVVDLQFTGTTMRNFKRIEGRTSFREDAVNVGFDDTVMHPDGPAVIDIALWNNEYFGDAWDISEKEIDQSFDEYVRTFNSPLLK